MEEVATSAQRTGAGNIGKSFSDMWEILSYVIFLKKTAKTTTGGRRDYERFDSGSPSRKYKCIQSFRERNVYK